MCLPDGSEILFPRQLQRPSQGQPQHLFGQAPIGLFPSFRPFLGLQTSLHGQCEDANTSIDRYEDSLPDDEDDDDVDDEEDEDAEEEGEGDEDDAEGLLRNLAPHD